MRRIARDCRLFAGNFLVARLIDAVAALFADTLFVPPANTVVAPFADTVAAPQENFSSAQMKHSPIAALIFHCACAVVGVRICEAAPRRVGGIFGGFVKRIAGARNSERGRLARRMRCRLTAKKDAKKCMKKWRKKRRAAINASRPVFGLIFDYTAASFPEIIRHIAATATMTRATAPNASRLVNARLFCWRDAHI